MARKLSWLIRNEFRKDPLARPKEIAAKFGTTAKYVSRLARAAGRPKFPTGARAGQPKELPTHEDSN